MDGAGSWLNHIRFAQPCLPRLNVELAVRAFRSRFSLESDADLNRFPCPYVDRSGGRMRCSGNRCVTLVGEVGISTACAIFAVRPHVCRSCVPGDEAAVRHGDASIFRRLTVPGVEPTGDLE
jgi:Fe-S-cluster containining protein